MKKVFKTLIYLFIIFISIIVFNYKSSIIEVETEVKGKMQTQEQINSCLNSVYGKILSFKIDDSGKSISGGHGTIPVGNSVKTYSQGVKYYTRYDAGNKETIKKVQVGIYDNWNSGKTLCMLTFEAGKKYYDVQFPANGSRSVSIELGFGIAANLYGVKELKVYSTFYYGKGNDSSKTKGSGTFDVRFRSSGPAFYPNGDGVDYRVPQPEYTSDGRLCFSTWMAENVSNFEAVWDEVEFNPSGSYSDPQGNFTAVSLTQIGNDARYIQTCSDNKIDISKVYTVKFIKITDALGYGNTNDSAMGKYIHPNLSASHTTTPATTTATTTEPQTSYGHETTTKKNEVGIGAGDDPLRGFDGILGQSNLSCDSGFSAILDEAWKIILICAPILTMLMGTIDFVQALVSSNAEGIKKASSGMIKRAVALLLLMLLKVIISIILNLFGITICF